MEPDELFDADGDDELDDEAGVSEEELVFCLSFLVLESRGEQGFAPASHPEALPPIMA
ncbi:MAG: hypothetical protein VYC24_06130 [Acidobacteriota bacterium]|nr:hypothetical protein [Acidobacteriota bacterium]